MKIALVGKAFSRSRGGGERVGVELASALREAGHEVSVYAGRVEDGGESGFTRVQSSGFSSALRVLTFHRNAARALRGGGHDVILGLTQFFPLDVYRAGGGVHAHWMRLRYKNPVVRAFKYAASPVHLAMAWLEKKIMEPGNCRFVIANSELVKGHIKKYFNVDENRIRVIYNGVDRGVFNPGLRRHRAALRRELGVPEGRTAGLFVSNNWERKGLRTILRALSLAHRKGVKLTVIVVGRGRKTRFLAQIKELGLGSDAVVFAGPVKDVERFYGAADFYVLPTQYDPASNTCFEAMASGLPVVTTASNGAGELLVHGESGYVLDDWSDHEGLYECFLALHDKTLRDAMGAKALHAAQGLTWQRTVSETIRVCEAALG